MKWRGSLKFAEQLSKWASQNVTSCITHYVAVSMLTISNTDLSWKFWSGEKIGPGDQDSWKTGLPGPFFLKNIGPSSDNWSAPNSPYDHSEF